MMMPVAITLESFLANGHGGHRIPGEGKRLGRKAEYGERLRPYSILLSQTHYDFLNRHGSGNASDAVRMLCEKHVRTPIKPQKIRLSKHDPRVQSSITLPSKLMQFLTEAGKGSLVSGIRLLIELETQSVDGEMM